MERGGLLRLSPRGSAVVGAAMQLIWVGVVAAHYISDPGFVMWIAGLGILLERAGGGVVRRPAEEGYRRVNCPSHCLSGTLM